MNSNVIDGFKFGMMLQFAVGPVCIFIFNTGCNDGFLYSEFAVFAVTLIDALFILLAILGITSFISKDSVKKRMKYFGAFIVLLFGINIISDVFNHGFLNLNFSSGLNNFNNPFIKGALLTASNPLTILFWAGVFSAKLAEKNNDKIQSVKFGFGAVLSTFIFLTLIAVVGSYVTEFLDEEYIRLLNFIVGLVLIVFAFLMMKNK